MKKLVIAEKKSVATSIAAVLGANATNGGYYESDKYIVSWCVGHLLTSAEPEAYDKKYASPWKVDVLPILPDVYKYVPIESSKRQLNILQGLLGRADVATIVNACDAGREGELIFRLVYDYCNCKKPLERLWISSLEESAISEGFKNLRAGSSYDNLHKAALCRQKADWIVGMNLSRLFSCVYYGRVNIGRVQTPTLAMIVERELKITNFVKEPFYTVEITGCGFTSARERLSDKSRAESIQQNCEGATATINSVTKQEKSESPLKLYDLTTLQRDANRLFGYTAAETLKITQNLYEQQLLTYPRTDSRYITEDMAAGIPPLVGQMVEILKSLNMSIHIEQNGINTRQITNNAKISDHHAIIPTPTTASVSVSIASLPKETKDILLMVCVRLVSAVSQKHTYAETVITTECKEELFTAKGKNVIIDGWKAVEHTFSEYCGKKKNEDDDKTTMLPVVTQGQQFQVTAATKEGFTQPPKHYTEDLLLSAMENAGVEDMPEDAERKGIGTPATRAESIEKLINVGYVERKGKQILPTQKGYALITVLPDGDLIKSPLLTAEWETSLKKIESGELSDASFMYTVGIYIENAININNTAHKDGGALSSGSTTPQKESLGKCPRCGGDVYEQQKSFSCGNYRSQNCSFAIWKENINYAPLSKKVLTAANAKSLLKNGKISMKGLHKKDGTGTYDAILVMTDTTDQNGKPMVNYSLEFPKK